MKHLVASFVCAVAIGVAAMPASAANHQVSYTIHDLGTLPGGFDAEAYAVAANGTVAGFSSTSTKSSHSKKTSSTTHAFLYSHGHLKDLGVPRGATASLGYAVSKKGVVAGAATLGQLEPYVLNTASSKPKWIALPHGARTATGMASSVNSQGLIVGSVSTVGAAEWRLEKGAYRLVSLRAGKGSVATFVDDKGDIVGHDATSALIWPRGGKAIHLSGLSSKPSQAAGITAKSKKVITVVGTSTTSNGKKRAVMWTVRKTRKGWTPGRPSRLLLPRGFLASQGQAINKSGEVVGIAYTKTKVRAYLWKGKTAQALNNLVPSTEKWLITWAAGINDKGQIVGWGSDAGRQRGFLMSPS